MGRLTWVADKYRNRVRPWLPARSEYSRRNGIPVADDKLRLFDRIVPFGTKGYLPNFKETNSKQLREHVSEGDDVLVIGAGFGVSTVEAAKAVGSSGSVVAYEANQERFEKARETISINGVADRVDIRHGAVGPPSGDFDFDGVEQVDLDALEEFDVIEMDCEGAELQILKETEARPRVFIVETHQEKDWTEYDSVETIENLLRSSGYSVETHHGQWVNGLVTGTLK
ncbi:FkbM family methyltransferase [Haloarchaeobius salinus]|uniref:FkbM family methyltransferase n=1 Tax=Haloarchaeobius salinus TaxID=1198298 RepID=UPI0021092574|nr:FkbM family methyltransferase [Haloarchaeobius salinus]